MPSAIDLSEFASRVDSARDDGCPMVLATAADGQPDVSLRGSMMVWDKDHLAFWERSFLESYDFLLRNPPIQRLGRTDPISKSVLSSAELPPLLSWLDPSLRVHAGIILAILAVAFVYWLLFRTTIGFEFRAAGLKWT